ncbi:20407_t:CDS:2 [Gigaspora rosea]|nr:20407_t:CDS:2 [Gigaspora rosea]
MSFGKSRPPPSSPNTELPETKANLFSKLTFWWVNDLMSLGYKRPLEKDDLYVLNDARTAKIVTDKFETEWKKETALRKKPSLIKALYRALWARFYLTVLVRLVCDILIVISPLILRIQFQPSHQKIISSSPAKIFGNYSAINQILVT